MITLTQTQYMITSSIIRQTPNTRTAALLVQLYLAFDQEGNHLQTRLYDPEATTD